MANQDNSEERPRRRQPDSELWKKAQEQYDGTDEERLEMLETTIARIWELPEEADQLLITISITGSLRMKRRMANLLASNPSLPWGLWLKLLQNLEKEDDQEIKQTLEPLLQPYRQFSESIKAWQEQVIGSIPQEFFTHIAEQQATFLRALAPMQEIQHLMQEILRLSFPVEQFRRTLESLSPIQIPKVQLPRNVLDSINTFSRYHDFAYSNFARLSPSYYPPEEKPLPVKACEHPLVAQLRELPPGKKTWPQYQKLCAAILSFCFVPPLLEPLYEESTEDNIHRRDLIYHIPHDASGFWAYVKNAHSALAVIVDAKNYAGILPKDQIVMTSKYFGSKKLGNFGIIVCRSELGVSGKKEQADRWVHHDEMIVCLTDDDLKEMIGLKLAEEDPEHVIDNRMRELRSGL